MSRAEWEQRPGWQHPRAVLGVVGVAIFALVVLGFLAIDNDLGMNLLPTGTSLSR